MSKDATGATTLHSLKLLPLKENLSYQPYLRLKIEIRGLVQGVGFRPFVYREAQNCQLKGFVRNTFGGLEIEVEGQRENLEYFIEILSNKAPPKAKIEHLQLQVVRPLEEIPLKSDSITSTQIGFQILPSSFADQLPTQISPDFSTCKKCFEEIVDPKNRRYYYPFTNCTDCGPRFSITKETPYDRNRTTMQKFQLCPFCQQEYLDPEDRRYHAEPNACSVCGPKITGYYSSNSSIQKKENFESKTNQEIIEYTRKLLTEGYIIALKGLGGFHLACNATDEKAVAELRRRKNRPHKPLAIMAKDLALVQKYFILSEAEKEELTSVRKPILLLEKRKMTAVLPPIAESIAPKYHRIGVMLPYTPLHHLLFSDSSCTTNKSPALLVMTSGNISKEPIITENDSAIKKLSSIADFFIIHDRDIWNRCDDSVGFLLSPAVLPQNNNLILIRRSRGFAPQPIQVEQDLKSTLALGAMYNNTFAFAKNQQVFLSQYIGNVDNLETLSFMKESIKKFQSWLRIDPEIIVHDLHPDFLTTHLAYELVEPDQKLKAVQHHHAHFISALIASDIRDEAIGLVFDGTGWGEDGTVWGGEILVGSAVSYERVGHLKALPLPGGEAAIKNPKRIGLAYLYELVPNADQKPLPIFNNISKEEKNVIYNMIDNKFNTPLTSSIGRLFDAVAALLGFFEEISYEGQAAIELEQLAWQGDPNGCPHLYFEIEAAAPPAIKEKSKYIINPKPIFSELVDLLTSSKVNKADLAFSFHKAVAEASAKVCSLVSEETKIENVVMSGGVFQNQLLIRLTSQALKDNHLNPILPSSIPVNDGGIALGQIMIANAQTKEGKELFTSFQKCPAFATARR